MMKHLITTALMAWAGWVAATDLVDVKPVTNRILAVHFDDGYARHHKRGELRTNEAVFINKLNVAKAMLLASYAIQSGDDAWYNTPLAPTSIGRKSKPTEFALLCQSYNNGCVNTDPDHALEHWVYLYLPTPLQSGKTYTLTLDALAENVNSVTFTFAEQNLHTETIHVNNIGYSTEAPAKYGYLYQWLGDKGGLDLADFLNKEFKLFDIQSNQFVFTGAIRFRKSKTNVETGQTTETPNANFSGADVYECDFSAFNTPGEYKLVVPGIGASFPFIIHADAYHEAFLWTMKGLYQNRSGIALTAPYAQFERPAPHHPQTTPGFSGRLKYSTFRTFDLSTYDGGTADKAKIEAGFKGNLTNTFGWYQDAGDWDGYYTHSHIPAYLLFLFEAGPQKFDDGELNIPESGNGLPDVLDEAAWLIRYFKRAKDEIKQKGWGTGGVPGARVFGDLWGSDAPNDIGQGSWQDVNRDWYLLGEDPWTTYKYAALAAQFAYILQSIDQSDPDGVDWMQEAEDAYAWAKANSKLADESPKGDYVLADMRLYAAASLYRLTGDWTYHNVAAPIIKSIAGSLDQGKQDQMFGVWMYLLAGNQDRDQSTLNVAQLLATASAEKYLSAADSRAARWGGNYFFPMLVGQGSTPLITPGVYGYLASKGSAVQAQRYLRALYTTADYFLGTNPLNMTWISGVGERHPVGLFHLDWWYFDKADPNNSLPVLKGVVPYGPWRFEDLGDLGWWNPNWAYSDSDGNARVYPAGAVNWPGHERWYDMRVSPLASEFTVHQNTVVAAFIYGFLTAGPSADFPEGIVTAIEPDAQDARVDVYPNPASNVIKVKAKEKETLSRIVLLGHEGKQIKSLTLAASQEAEVDVHMLPAGVYLMRITLTRGDTIARHVQVMK
jgi:endoglucanase